MMVIFSHNVSDTMYLSVCDTMYLLISFGKSTPPQNRQLVVHYASTKYQVDSFMGKLTS